MKRLFATAIAVGLCMVSVAAAQHVTVVPKTEVPGHLRATQAAHRLIRRLLPDHAKEFTCQSIAPADGHDVFEIETRNGRVILRGNNAVSIATGLNWYLKHYCHCNVSLRGTQLDLPDRLPDVPATVRKVSWAEHRYLLNYCCFGYSLAWWDWDQWEELIDWMALHGVNMPLSVTGQEAVWQAVCRRLGLSDQQTAAFLAGPPYLPFGWMGCLDGWGGPLPQAWIDRHEELEKKILRRERELGMTPVLQGFTGHVPAGIAAKHPSAKLHEIRWIEWTTRLLDPLDPLFAKVAKIYMQEQSKRFGTDHVYAADTFIEMTPPRGDLEYLDRLSRAIYSGMTQSDPQAVWVLQTWIFLNKQTYWTQPRIKAFLGAVPNERIVCLDLFCEERPQWLRTQAFYGKPWLWCNIQNFGNTVFLGGSLRQINDGPHAARHAENGGNMVGLGFVNEGLGYNPIVHDLMFEMAWHDRAAELSQWIDDYATSRYGKRNTAAQRAWTILHETVYAAAHRNRSVIQQVPSLTPAKDPPYDNARLAEAWHQLLQAADTFGTVDTYRFDLVNTARQVLSNHAAVLQRKLIEAYRSGDLAAFQETTGKFIGLIRDLDQLLATRREFLLGRTLADARRWGTSDAERARYEWNARRVLTLWGTGQAIRDYASKEWSGMLNGFYAKRWQWYFDELTQAERDARPFDQKAFARDLMKWESDWASGRRQFTAEPHGDSVAVAQRLWVKYGPLRENKR